MCAEVTRLQLLGVLWELFGVLGARTPDQGLPARGVPAELVLQYSGGLFAVSRLVAMCMRGGA